KPLIMMPLTGSGGNVHGTEIDTTLRPASLRICQNVLARRWLPLTNSRSYEPGRGRKKSNTPCLPGFLPVMKLVQAGNVQGGIVERSGPDTPVCMSLAMLGSLPWATQGRIKSKVAPSQPTMKTRVPKRLDARIAKDLLG